MPLPTWSDKIEWAKIVFIGFFYELGQSIKYWFGVK